MLLLVSLTLSGRQGHRHLGQQPARSAGRSTSRTSCGGSASATPGTLISAILLLLRQTWRTSINRFAEAMTLFAVACAGIFPLFHTGRPVARVLAAAVSEHDGRLAAVPEPADLGRVRGFDLRDRVAAVLVRRPDSRSRDAARSIAVARRPRSSTACSRWAGAAPRATGTATRRRICCWPAWRRRWSCRCTRSSASTSRSSIVPGWHTTIFPPYFVAGAIYSGFAMVLDAGDSDPRGLRARGLHHHAPPAEHGEGDARAPA